MKFSIKRKNVEGELLELERSFWSGSFKIRQQDRLLERLNEKGRPFAVSMKDGSTGKLRVASRWLDPVPVVFLDAEEILLAEPLRFIDYLFACFPVLMFLVYGALSTLVGFFLLLGNFRILRSKMQPSVKWAAIYALDIVSFWIVVAIVKFAITAGK